jgi:hypothetical protein
MDDFSKMINYPRLQNVMIKEGNTVEFEIAYQKLVEDIV